MKNLFAILTSCILSAAAFGEYSFSMSGGYFYAADDLENYLTEANIAIIVDREKGDFSDFELNVGDIISSTTAMNDRYFVLESSTLSSLPEFSGTMNISMNIENSTYSFTGGETFAVLCFVPSETFTGQISAGTEYVVFNPQMVTESDVDALSGGRFDWVIPTSDGEYFYRLITGEDAPYIPVKYTTLSNVVIPEPAWFAAAFGALALFFGLRRRS